MIRGLYTSASSMITLQREMSIESNNLANMNTSGFKTEYIVRKSYPRNGLVRTHDRSQALPPTFFRRRPPLGPMNTGVENSGSYTDFSQGALYQTGNSLDLAIEGPGFFAVETEGGEEAYTRNGSFVLNDEQELVTSSGHRVLGRQGPVTIPAGVNDVRVVANGQIVDSNNRLLARLKISQFENPQKLRQRGSNLYSQGSNNPLLENPEDFTIHQGTLEKSNSNPTKRLVQLIEVNRRYEMNTQMIQQQSSTLGEAIQTVGRS